MVLLSNTSSILAGNSRLSLKDENIIVEPQIAAFQQALIRAASIAEETGVSPRVSIAFDHRGVFRKQFLREGLTNSQKRNPRLSQLCPAITEVFAPAAEQVGISLDDILIIHEDSAKSYLEHLVDEHQIPATMLRHVVSERPTAKNDDVTCTLEGGCNARISCAAITAEYFRKAASVSRFCDELKEPFHADDVLEVFFEDDPWSSNTVYVRGLQLAQYLGVNIGIQLNLVLGDKKVASGHLTYPRRVK